MPFKDLSLLESEDLFQLIQLSRPVVRLPHVSGVVLEVPVLLEELPQEKQQDNDFPWDTCRGPGGGFSDGRHRVRLSPLECVCLFGAATSFPSSQSDSF